MKKISKEEYSYYSKDYPIYSLPLIGKIYFNRLNKVIKQINTKNKKILDIGFGFGLFLRLLSKNTDKLYGTNPDMIQFKETEHIFKRFKINNIRLFDYYAQNMNFDDSFFDLVYANSVLEHILELDKSIIEIKRVIKNEGYFIVSSPIEERLYKLLRIIFRKKKPKDHYNSISLIEDKLKKHFLLIKKNDYPFGLPGFRIFVCKKIK